MNVLSGKKKNPSRALAAAAGLACSLALFLFLSSVARATPIDMKLTIDYYSVPSWVEYTGISFTLFESDANNWPTALTPPSIVSGNGLIEPGTTEFNFTASAASPSDVYLKLWGEIQHWMPPNFTNIYIGEPPGSYVPCGLAWSFGPPWIPLGDLDDAVNLSGDLYIINGVDTQADTDHPWKVGTWQLETLRPVPEPSLLAPFLIGLAGVIGFKCKRNG